jgi:selenocysteine lyase/cysteine desulfurase
LIDPVPAGAPPRADIGGEVGRYFAALRRREFARLDAAGLAYLDYNGSALHGSTQLAQQFALLEESLFGNPHSESAPSRATTEILERERERVLRFFDVDDSTHAVCFTANATAALQLIGESYPFARDRRLVLSTDNHNSVLGLREYARRAGAPVAYLPLDADLRLDAADARLAELPGGGLLAFPAQSNFSGVRHPLALAQRARELGFEVVVDFAAFAPTAPVSLRDVAADFAVFSFYKLFGYPTGLGALVAPRSALAGLRRPWFSGGTVAFASVQADRHRLRPGHQGFEDGTPNFLAIAALGPGFALLEEVGFGRLARHVAELTAEFLSGLAGLRHGNGRPMIEVHGPTGPALRGGAVAFNVRDPVRRRIPFSRVEERARLAGVALRGGCFCNPGAAEAALGLDPARTQRCLAEIDALESAFTPERFADCLGGGAGAVGAVRASFGMATDRDDLRRAIAVLESFRDETAPPH